MVLFSFMSFQSTSGLVRRLSQSTNYTRKEKINVKYAEMHMWHIVNRHRHLQKKTGHEG